ncbi:MCP2 / mitochondrial carrier protein [Leishmania donovani]|uniref:Mitochondrial_carrier_protein-like_protein n=3 Tax=Leishmania donovani species complex TaxID=38574 RepID=A0A6L0XNB4_LEIIN|nr:mitochondrial carrier protein-like protein [Leishmania infantum JPCM5]XP_003863534.1 mitochondrial carrier protein-like protein [Leishmania donovani]CAC9524204.1 mitochondrial_carrier_protein-like_protein [Leishmania infantum]TPP43632.1 Mitochondrial carrier family protein [Leishmania donovani]TPP47128.1 Mitochondrial carrier family protein [Leishmania donovani]CAJ1991652.1 MCP2 / mitochondrial carrier protein [Leishmania donovani]CAM70865.1 mitochondrial carrier protein-like protein [Leis|eukprot:XP_001467798.1 mitochondrial carrier protein-like protein [Leishmania infantum JPCM5]
MAEKQSAAPKATALQHTVASQLGGAASTILLYPVDVIRIRFTSQDGTHTREHNGQTYRSILKAFQLIYRLEGGLPVFFRGCHVSVCGTVCAWGVYMYLYRCQCTWYEAWQAKRREAHCSGSGGSRFSETESLAACWAATWQNLLERFGFSIIASCTSAVACNPIWLLKTRMQLEEASARTAEVPRNFRTFRGGLLHTVQTTGVRSLWRGVSAQMVLAVPNAFTLPLYDTVKAAAIGFRKGELSVLDVCVCSTVTKVVLALICQPVIVVKTRLQDHRARTGEIQYRSFLQSIRTIWKRGGLAAFYRGSVPSMCQTVPRSVLMFVFYEHFLKAAQHILP